MKKIPKISFSNTSKIEIEFEIFTLESLFSRRDKLGFLLDKPHRVDFYHILFITKGTGAHFIDFKRHKYQEGSILFISKGQVHSFEVNSDREGFVIIYTEKFLLKNLIHLDISSLSRLYNYHLHSPVIQTGEMGKNNFINIINEIYEEYNFPDDFAKKDILRLLLKLLLLKAERIKSALIPKEKNSEWLRLFSTFRNKLENHFAKTRNAQEYAEMMYISYKHLNKICKSITGSTAKEFINNFIILEIKKYLATSDISIKELTYEMGFDEPTNLVKFFKKRALQSPSQFRSKLTK